MSRPPSEPVPALLRALMSELGAEPGNHFAMLSPRALWAFLDGYALAVPSFTGTLRRVDDRVARDHRTRLALSAGALTWLAEGDTAAGYRALLRQVTAALPGEAVDEDAPLARSVVDLLPTLRARMRAVSGVEDVRDCADLVRGLHRGLVDRGIDPTPDRARLAAFERHLQQELGFTAPWERLVEVWDGAADTSAARFVERFGAWLAADTVG